MLHGVLHREDGPAEINPGVAERWYLNGHLHRDGGPAVTYFDAPQRNHHAGPYRECEPPGTVRGRGTQFWFSHGKLHRTDGPAIVRAHGDFRLRNEWWVDGIEVVGLGRALFGLPQRLHVPALELCLAAGKNVSADDIVGAMRAASSPTPT